MINQIQNGSDVFGAGSWKRPGNMGTELGIRGTSEVRRL